MSGLGALFSKYGSDKCVHGYDNLYEMLLRHRRFSIKAMLEVGIGSLLSAPFSMEPYAKDGYRPGASLRAWRDWLPNAVVNGMDIAGDTIITDEERIVTFLCSSLNRTAVQTAFGYSLSFDLIVDDGNHHAYDQINTLCILWPYLKGGGIYVVEDIIEPEEWKRFRLTDLIGRESLQFVAKSKWHVLVIQKGGGDV